MSPHNPPVFVALQRPVGYEDVHPDLVAVDALDGNDPWPHEVVRYDGRGVVIKLDRPEDYEGVPSAELARLAINKDWPAWRLVKA